MHMINVSELANEIYKIIEKFDGHPIFSDILVLDEKNRAAVRFALCELIGAEYVKPVRVKDIFGNKHRIEYHMIEDSPWNESFWK